MEQAKPSKGILYGVGVGPGDIELLTLKAHRLIMGAAHLAYFAPTGGISFARSIIDGIAPSPKSELAFEVPMVAGRAPAQSIYDEAVMRIRPILEGGGDVVMLCEGDPLTYGSFIYIMSRLREVTNIQIVPGVSSVQACAAAAGFALASRNEAFQILPAPLEDHMLSQAIDQTPSCAIIKLGRHLPRIRNLLKVKGLVDQTHYIARVGLEDQQICNLADAPQDAPYFSMLLLYHGDEPWR